MNETERNQDQMTWSLALANYVRGVCMGAADAVPGVSGGTVALVLGIYQRLIRAISSFDTTAVKLVANKNYKAAAEHVDLRFLLVLGLGIATGFILIVKFLSHFLEDDTTRSYILAAFCGMIIAAAMIVARMIMKLDKPVASANWVAAVVGVILAGIISQMGPTQGASSEPTEPGLLYLFVCGAFAICAMILPGISGALILVLLGVYQYLVHVAKAILHFEELPSNLLRSICFAAGCAVGLALFSRILRRLLEQRPGPTLSMLCGLIIGSLPLLWPFQENTTPDIEDVKLRVYEPFMPELMDAYFWTHVAVFLMALIFVLGLEWIGSRVSTQPRDI